MVATKYYNGIIHAFVLNIYCKPVADDLDSVIAQCASVVDWTMINYVDSDIVLRVPRDVLSAITMVVWG